MITFARKPRFERQKGGAIRITALGIRGVSTSSVEVFTGLATSNGTRPGLAMLVKELDKHVAKNADQKLSSFVNIADFTPAQKTLWFTQLFAVQPPLGQETPSLDAVVRIGEYYKNGTHPQLVGSTDPIVLACQKNWHMFFTDGFTNQTGLPPTVYGDQDDVVPPLPVPVPGLTPGSPWPPPCHCLPKLRTNLPLSSKTITVSSCFLPTP